LVEHPHGKGEVIGSSPIAGSTLVSTPRLKLVFLVKDKIMAKNRIIVHLECTETGMRNYTIRVPKNRKFGKIALKKYCPKLRRHTLHKETK
jgi:large subunit ribosomal protein L33